MRYHHGLMQMILNDRAQIAKAVNATIITLDQAPDGYKDFDQGAAKKFVLNPHGLLGVRDSRARRDSERTLVIRTDREAGTPQSRRQLLVNVVEYTASGGPSAIFEFPDNEELTAEVHAKTFAALWSCHLSAEEWMGRVLPLLPSPSDGQALIIGSDMAEADELPIVDAERVLRQHELNPTFVRLRYDDRAVSWEQLLTQQGDPGASSLAEVGLLAEGFDHIYLSEVVRATATPTLAEHAGRMADRIGTLVARFPRISL
jgi:hypothetical protein